MEECPNGPCATMFGPCVADTDCIGKKHCGSVSSQFKKFSLFEFPAKAFL